MKLKDYYVTIHKKEGKKVKTPIAQIREVVKVENKVLSKETGIKDFLYKVIRKM